MPGPFTLADIVSRYGGRVAGHEDTLIRQVGSLVSAGPDQITFFSNPRYKTRLASTRAGAVVLAPDAESMTNAPRIVIDNPYAYFARVSQLFNPAPAFIPGVHGSAQISDGVYVSPDASIGAGAIVERDVSIGAGAFIGAGCYVGESVRIGDGCILHPSVTICRGCRIGRRVILHSGVVIGADGFGIAREEQRWLKIPQIGSVRIGDDVEIGANTTVDRGAIDDTVIEEGVKLDNQIQIGHNVRVGAHTAMAGCVAVAGSADIGRNCTIGAAAVILGHLQIVDNVNVSAATVISRSIRKPGTYTGMFPFDENASWAKNTALVRHLAQLAQRVRELEKQLSRQGSGND